MKDVDKSKSITEMSQEELHQLISRLRGEREVECIIRDLKYNSGERNEFEDFKIDTTTPINELYHHGIKNQKWGVRRFQNSDGTRTAAGKEREKIKASEDHNQSVTDRSKATKGLSNAELRRLNERMQLEKTYRDLSKAEKDKGESLAKKILKDIAKKSLTDAGTKLMTDILNTTVSEPLAKNIKKSIKKNTEEN